VTGNDSQTQKMIDSGTLVALPKLLESSKDALRKEACWTISNITAGSVHQIQSVINAQLIPPLIKILSYDEFKTKKEAAWAISNATSGGNKEQIMSLPLFKNISMTARATLKINQIGFWWIADASSHFVIFLIALISRSFRWC